MRSFMVGSHCQISLRGQIKEDEIDWACSMHKREPKCKQGFGGET
jgi:hypothetical protein